MKYIFLAINLLAQCAHCFVLPAHPRSLASPTKRLPTILFADGKNGIGADSRTEPYKGIGVVYPNSDRNGAILLGAVLVGCMWFFSVPTEIRRAHVCQSDSDFSKASGCIQPAEWRQLVKDHYATCGETNTCVQWDFSVEEGGLLKPTK